MSTADCNDLHALLGSEVSVKYVHGGEKRDGFFIDDVDIPFSVAETLERRPSELLEYISPTQVTTVRDGSVTVLHPRRPAEVGKDVCVGGAAGPPSADAASGTSSDVVGMTTNDANKASRREKLILSSFVCEGKEDFFVDDDKSPCNVKPTADAIARRRVKICRFFMVNYFLNESASSLFERDLGLSEALFAMAALSWLIFTFCVVFGDLMSMYVTT